MLRISGFVDDAMFARDRPDEGDVNTLNVTHQGQHGFDLAANTAYVTYCSPQQVTSRPGRSLMTTIALFIDRVNCKSSQRKKWSSQNKRCCLRSGCTNLS